MSVGRRRQVGDLNQTEGWGASHKGAHLRQPASLARRSSQIHPSQAAQESHSCREPHCAPAPTLSLRVPRNRKQAGTARPMKAKSSPAIVPSVSPAWLASGSSLRGGWEKCRQVGWLAEAVGCGMSCPLLGCRRQHQHLCAGRPPVHQKLQGPHTHRPYSRQCLPLYIVKVRL